MYEDEHKPIEPPKKAPARKLTRDITEAIAGEVPFVGPAVVAVLRSTHPSTEEKGREQWELDVTKRTNQISDTVTEHEKILRPPPVRITDVTAELAAFLVRLPHEGLCREYMLTKVAPNLPSAPPFRDVVDAAEEMALYGLVEVNRFLGGQEASARVRPALFDQLDPQIMGWTPAVDARHLATLLLGDDRLCMTAKLHAASGWEKRRFNPAMRYLLQFFEPGHISNEIQPDYPTNQVMMFGSSRARLRRFTGEAS